MDQINHFSIFSVIKFSTYISDPFCTKQGKIQFLTKLHVIYCVYDKKYLLAFFPLTDIH